ncbi:unnamed protein product [Arabis nemorensis]|uniref:DNA2/NAM7 helicase helicase domain-containing protein n=1 Tax=Arabis nemorensis TaxID=586526 RepID=A0A565BPA9_9BRAS|nr:unnamed protein product [Arabis nemorensis]
MEKNQKTSMLDRLCSWSIKDILNEDLHKDKLETIPDRFGSVVEYFQCFVPHLLEETRAELFSGLNSLSKAPVFKIHSVKTMTMKSGESSSIKLFHEITLMDAEDISDKYKPECGDLIALSLTKELPIRIDDLNPLLLAYVFRIYSLCFGGFLMNLNTNTRIWNALHNEDANLTLIQSVLQPNTLATEQCVCENNVDCSDYDRVLDIIRSAKLNSSQEAAILSCLKKRNCNHMKSVKLIWGPPGTGKTKTVATLLVALLKLECKTVVCAPTNAAIVELASRLLALSKEMVACDLRNRAIVELASRFSSLFYETSTIERTTYGMGNIVLSGNRKRMGIDKNEVLLDVFLDHRISKLEKLFSSSCAWKQSLESIIDLLENTEAKYEQHVHELEEAERIVREERAKKEAERKKQEAEKRKEESDKEEEEEAESKKDEAESKKEEIEKEKEEVVNIPTLGEFVWKKFNGLSEVLKLYMVNLYTHLPKSLISFEDVKKMIAARQALERVKDFLQDNSSREDFKKESFRFDCFRRSISVDCLVALNLLPKCFLVPDLSGYKSIRRFCLQEADIIFCTASGAAKLNEEKTVSIDLLLVDEAAQLKECEIGCCIAALRFASRCSNRR